MAAIDVNNDDVIRDTDVIRIMVVDDHPVMRRGLQRHAGGRGMVSRLRDRRRTGSRP